jgi:flagellar hook-basal body complex protein FliE
MSDALRDQVRELYASLRSLNKSPKFTTFLQKTPSQHEDEAASAVETLKRAYDDLSDLFQLLIAAGEVGEARKVKAVMDQVAAASIAINRAVIDYLDSAADLATAKAQLERAKADLETEAERVKTEKERLDNVAGALDVLTQLVNL